MNLLRHVLICVFIALLSACSNNPQRVNTSIKAVEIKPAKPVVVKPARLPTPSELVGKYPLFAGSEVSFDISQQNGNLFFEIFGVKSPMQALSATRFRLEDGNEIRFDYSQKGEYDRFVTINEGRPRLFIREDSLQRARAQVNNQSVYTQQVMRDAKPGGYAYSRFLSPSRGLVDYSIYLPPQWQRNSRQTYPLVFFLHGQLGWERSFPDSVPASQLNQWIAQRQIPPMVIVSLRTGRLKANVEEQWSSTRNEKLLTSENSNELRQFIRQHFRAGMSAKTTAIHGYSRGSRGAIHFALKYPTRFSSAVANAFVSDYALDQTKRIAQNNLAQIQSQGIPLRISIGDQDEFALNMGRRASPIIHQFLKSLNIPHDYEVFPGINHGFVNVWNTRQGNGKHNGLGELQFHAAAWTGSSNN